MLLLTHRSSHDGFNLKPKKAFSTAPIYQRDSKALRLYGFFLHDKGVPVCRGSYHKFQNHR